MNSFQPSWKSTCICKIQKWHPFNPARNPKGPQYPPLIIHKYGPNFLILQMEPFSRLFRNWMAPELVIEIPSESLSSCSAAALWQSVHRDSASFQVRTRVRSFLEPSAETCGTRRENEVNTWPEKLSCSSGISVMWTWCDHYESGNVFDSRFLAHRLRGGYTLAVSRISI